MPKVLCSTPWRIFCIEHGVQRIASSFPWKTCQNGTLVFFSLPHSLESQGRYQPIFPDKRHSDRVTHWPKRDREQMIPLTLKGWVLFVSKSCLCQRGEQVLFMSKRRVGVVCVKEESRCCCVKEESGCSGFIRDLRVTRWLLMLIITLWLLIV
jgi:hypothetical protein